MSKDDVIEIYSAPEIYVDGFTQHTSRDGVMTCVGYRKMPEGRVVVVKLVWPAANTNAAIEDALSAMSNPEIEAERATKRSCH